MRHSFGDRRRGAPLNTGARLGGMVALLIVIGLLYSQAKRPETWKWLAQDDRDAAQAVNSETEPTTTASRTSSTSPSSAAPRAADISPGMQALEAAKKQGTSTASTTATGTAATSTADVAAQPAATTTAAGTAGSETAAKSDRQTFRDTVVPGPTDADPEEVAAAQSYFELITDRKELHEKNDMGSYWRLFRWTWAQTFEELEKRASREVLFQQLGETPQKYRGKPIRLRLHVKQIVKWDAPENRGNFKHIYEIWGATDDSMPFPYVVVVSELPPGLKIGANLRHEGVFVGYFLKNMAYRAHDVHRWAPLLVGRMHWQKDSSVAMREATDNHVLWQWLAGAALAAMLGVWIWLRFARISRPATAISPAADAEVEAWFGDSPTTSETSGMSFDSPPTEAIDAKTLEVPQSRSPAPAAPPDRDQAPPMA